MVTCGNMTINYPAGILARHVMEHVEVASLRSGVLCLRLANGDLAPVMAENFLAAGSYVWEQGEGADRGAAQVCLYALTYTCSLHQVEQCSGNCCMHVLNCALLWKWCARSRQVFVVLGSLASIGVAQRMTG